MSGSLEEYLPASEIVAQRPPLPAGGWPMHRWLLNGDAEWFDALGVPEQRDLVRSAHAMAVGESMPLWTAFRVVVSVVRGWCSE